MDSTFIELKLEIYAPPAAVWHTLKAGAWAEAFFRGCRVESAWQPGAEILWREKRMPPFAKGRIILMNEQELRAVYYQSPESNILTDFVENYQILPRKNIVDLRLTIGPWEGAEDRVEWAAEHWESAALKIKKLAEKYARQ
jgi:hypothetical protein